MKIGRRDGLRMVNRLRAVDTHAARLQLSREGVKQLIRPINRFLRTTAPLAAHVAVFGHFRIQSGFFGWNMTIIRAPDDHMTQRVPFIPTIYNCLLHLKLPIVLNGYGFYEA